MWVCVCVTLRIVYISLRCPQQNYLAVNLTSNMKTSRIPQSMVVPNWNPYTLATTAVPLGSCHSTLVVFWVKQYQEIIVQNTTLHVNISYTPTLSNCAVHINSVVMYSLKGCPYTRETLSSRQQRNRVTVAILSDSL